jgi:hypothetical protein
MNGAGIGPDDQRALIVRRVLPDGRTWGTTSVSLVSLAARDGTGGVRYDFNATPGDPGGWQEIS